MSCKRPVTGYLPKHADNPACACRSCITGIRAARWFFRSWQSCLRKSVFYPGACVSSAKGTACLSRFWSAHTACAVYFKCLGCMNKEGIETKRTRPLEEWFSHTIFRKPCKIISIVLKSAQRNALISLWRCCFHLSGVCQTVAANNRLCYGSIFYSLFAFAHSLPRSYKKCKCRIF